MKIDWNTGNIIFNGIILNKDNIDEIIKLRRIFELNNDIMQGDIFKTNNSVIKILDITSENVDSNLEEEIDNRFNIIYNEKEYLFIINNNHEIFLKDKITNEKLKGKYIIFLDLKEKQIIYRAMEYKSFIEMCIKNNYIKE